MGPIVIVAQQQSSGPNVCFGSKADIGLPPIDVRYSPKSGHWQARLKCLLSANSGLMRAAKILSFVSAQ
jgi:hypothetical protein